MSIPAVSAGTTAYVRGIIPDKANRERDDFYPTPPAGTRALLEVESFTGPIWEPACGDGAISKVLESAGHQVISTDLIDRGYGTGGGRFPPRLPNPRHQHHHQSPLQARRAICPPRPEQNNRQGSHAVPSGVAGRPCAQDDVRVHALIVGLGVFQAPTDAARETGGGWRVRRHDRLRVVRLGPCPCRHTAPGVDVK